MIDLHSHILPGVDDGAQSLTDSFALAKEAVNNGITTLFATPHHLNGVYTNHKQDVLDLVDYLQAEIDKQGIPLTILPGQEVHIYGEIVKDLQLNTLLTYNDQQKYLLLELPYDHVPAFVDRVIYEILLQGIIPIIPHPERNRKIREHPDLLYKMVKQGAMSQITAASLVGKFGFEVQKFSLQCVEHGLAHVIASDAHRAGKRGFYMQEAYQELDRQFGSQVVYEFKQTAERIAKGQEVYVEPPQRIQKKRSWFSFLKRR
ncbi:tyrosine protein phosphatase [Caldalkalibacillus thermarum]|uniref:tyrosine-protein phosphatase n=1 Tax=Caldalkalibacillus thermarum TaxID=296745 RepID=UPI00166348F0|nr:CpsB/CapC family capsule biosynthesis tyrosine phosphatase [Caldalkalibacillus thermarum]GGK34060.1 tyrosine protein phosphatase [Caldalkalibacillus thermarum]